MTAPNTEMDTNEEWDLIAKLLLPGVERIMLEQMPSSVKSARQARLVHRAALRVRPLPCGKGRGAREGWILAYLQYTGKASRNEMVKVSGIPNSTMGRLLSSLLEKDLGLYQR